MILEMGLSSQLQTQLQISFPYTWSNFSIPFLVLQLTVDPGKLVDANYLPLIDKLTRETKRLSKVELSWSGHLASFKMLLLPQILYSKALLIKHRLAGFMGLTDLYDFFWASMLTQLKNWFTPSPDILCHEVEQALSPASNLCSLLALCGTQSPFNSFHSWFRPLWKLGETSINLQSYRPTKIYSYSHRFS